MTSFRRILVPALACAFATPAFAAVERSFPCDPQGGQCPKAVADAHGETAGITLSTITLGSAACDGATAAVAGVSVDIPHGHVGDLTLELLSPAGTPVQLIGRLDGPDGGAGACASDDLVTRFSAGGDAATCSAFGEIPATAPQVRASGNLAALGETIAPAGAWQLRVTDAVPGGYGLIAGWTLHLSCAIGPTVFQDGFEE